MVLIFQIIQKICGVTTLILDQLKWVVDGEVIDSSEINIQYGDQKKINIYAMSDRFLGISMDVTNTFYPYLDDETIVKLDENENIIGLKLGTTNLRTTRKTEYTGNYAEALTINVEKADPEYTAPTGLTATYGQTLSDVELPEGFTWESEATTSVGNVGENTFTVTYTPQDTTNYNTISGIEVKITVGKATYDMSGITFVDKSFTYDGTKKKVEISGTLPEGVSVSYENNTGTNVGEYIATAIFTGDGVNYNPIENKTAKLTIGKATYDMSEVTFVDTSYTYDGTEQSIVISGTLPEGVVVSYENNTGINAGEYTATAIFTGDAVNYNPIENKTAKLTIQKANPEYTVPTGLTATYGQTLADIELPEGFTWESEATTSVGQEGENTFTVTYTPQDTVNYKVVTGIEVKITVMTRLSIDLGEYLAAEENETKYMQGISPNTTIATLKSEITTNGEIQVYNGETPITEEDTKIATGMEIRIVLNGEHVSYKAVVKGDITGDGVADISDLVLLARYVAKTDKNVETIKLKAMEINNEDGLNTVDMSDLVIMARYVAKRINQL